MKPFSEACDQNKDPILGVLREELADAHSVLEIGSGTGQHAVYFARQLTHLTWYATDLPEHHAGMRLWFEEANITSIRGPLDLDVRQAQWPVAGVGAVFSANTAHIMDWQGVASMFAGVGRVLLPAGVFCLYGPFNYGGCYTSDSNANFDRWLKNRDPRSGIRDFEALDELASAAGMLLQRDYEMPVNNRTLVWRKRSSA
ncbi:MAG: methylase [Gammaproteobacteria bacterium SG8_47]|nr:MAG: methylase [Gammaproteobacteria bacterium SG8_47]